ncbi:hypothetical protein BH24ACT3_BH24ACT3_05350 [soil metagenome]
MFDDLRRARLSERWTAVAFGVSILAALGLAVVYSVGGQVQLEGDLLAVALGGIGIAIVVWAKNFMPSDEVTEERKPLASTEDEVAAFTSEYDRGGRTIARRGLLVKMGGGALAALAAALLFPIRSLGPRPGKGFKTTSFAEGVRLVTAEGEPILAASVSLGTIITAFPEGDESAADAPTLLIGIERDRLTPREGREDWTVDDVVAFSKLCTHTGCPVGLYQQQEALLLCPCHQSTFDVTDGARPIFGPAARSLPQLPISEDDGGYLVADGDFSGPTGAGFWDRDR